MSDGHPRSDPKSPNRRGVLRWLLGALAAPFAACGAAIRFTALRELIRGRVVERGDPGFDEDRRRMLWSTRVPDRHPAAIAHVASTRELQTAVQFARERGLRLCVRGGGHHFNAPILQQDSLLLDLEGLRELSIDADSRRATVSPGVSGRELIAALSPHGLGFPIGHCGSVPLSGYLLNGGFGWNSGAWGPACASVEAVDVVTADGALVRADASNHAELFWAVRGAGPYLPAIVTRFHLRLHELPRAIRTSTLVFDAKYMAAAAKWLAAVQPGLPPAVELAALVVSPPPEQRAAGAPRRTFVVAATAFADTEEQALTWLAPFAEGPAGIAAIDRQHDVATTFDGLLDGMDGLFPSGHRYASDHLWSRAGAAELTASMGELALDPPSARNFVLMAYGPNLPASAPPLPDMALSIPGRVYVGIYGVWSDATADARNRRWIADVSSALHPHGVGRYVGEVDLDGDEEHVAACFSPGTRERLAMLRDRIDPGARFARYAGR